MVEDQRQGEATLTIATAAVADGVVVLTVTGALDYHTAGRFGAAVQQAFEAGAATVTADVSAVGFTDSSGLAALIRAHKAAHLAGRRFALRGPDHNLRRILTVTGLDTVLDIAEPSAED
ncbi:STAS domain-containing protein [Dactylosporangium sp. McL0621]|uniref:STAS domain-containing protein n=1 Tax=Dactylosporangium sp. McL0621 TaxID=3415678 RepID=UPI003CFB2C79